MESIQSEERASTVTYLWEDDKQDVVAFRKAERLCQPPPWFLLVGSLDQSVLYAIFCAAQRKLHIWVELCVIRAHPHNLRREEVLSSSIHLSQLCVQLQRQEVHVRATGEAVDVVDVEGGVEWQGVGRDLDLRGDELILVNQREHIDALLINHQLPAGQRGKIFRLSIDGGSDEQVALGLLQLLSLRVIQPVVFNNHTCRRRTNRQDAINTVPSRMFGTKSQIL